MHCKVAKTWTTIAISGPTTTKIVTAGATPSRMIQIMLRGSLGLVVRKRGTMRDASLRNIRQTSTLFSTEGNERRRMIWQDISLHDVNNNMMREVIPPREGTGTWMKGARNVE